MAGMMDVEGAAAAIDKVWSAEAKDEEEGTDTCPEMAITAVTQFPQSPRVLLCFASVFMRMQRLQRIVQDEGLAQQVFIALDTCTGAENASALSPEERSVAHGLKGVFLSRIAGDIEGGMKEFEASLSLNADNIDALFCCASILDQVMGKVSEAESFYDRVLQIDPEHVTSLNNYSALLIERGRDEAFDGPSRALARELLLRAARLAPGFPQYNLACLAALELAAAAPEYQIKGEEECRKWLMAAWENGGIPEPQAQVLETDADFASVREKDWFVGLLMNLKAMWSVDFCQHQVRLLPPEGGVCRARETDELVGTTGATVWNSSFAVLRFLESAFASNVQGNSLKQPQKWGSSPDWWQGKRVLDLSAGLGLVGLSLAKLGADVVLTDIGADQIDVLKRNAILSGLNESQVHCQILAWGDIPAVQMLMQTYGPFDVVFAVDLVYITVRENNAPALIQTLSTLAQGTTHAVVLCFEERQPAAEAQLLAELGKTTKICAQTFDSSLIDEDTRNGASTTESMFAGLNLDEKPAISMLEVTKM